MEAPADGIARVLEVCWDLAPKHLKGVAKVLDNGTAAFELRQAVLDLAGEQ